MRRLHVALVVLIGLPAPVLHAQAWSGWQPIAGTSNDECQVAARWRTTTESAQDDGSRRWFYQIRNACPFAVSVDLLLNVPAGRPQVVRDEVKPNSTSESWGNFVFAYRIAGAELARRGRAGGTASTRGATERGGSSDNGGVSEIYYPPRRTAVAGLPTGALGRYTDQGGQSGTLGASDDGQTLTANVTLQARNGARFNVEIPGGRASETSGRYSLSFGPGARGPGGSSTLMCNGIVQPAGAIFVLTVRCISVLANAEYTFTGSLYR